MPRLKPVHMVKPYLQVLNSARVFCIHIWYKFQISTTSYETKVHEGKVVAFSFSVQYPVVGFWKTDPCIFELRRVL